MTRMIQVSEDALDSIKKMAEQMQTERDAYKEALQYAIWQYNGGGSPAHNHWSAKAMNTLAKFNS